MTMITPPPTPRKKEKETETEEPPTYSVSLCDYIHPITNEKCKKNCHFSIVDKYNRNLRYTCFDHLDDIINGHFSLKQTIRIKSLEPCT